MTINQNLPSYTEQFGVDFQKGEDARSIYSPGAYLADLLQLLDDYFAHHNLHERRSDLKGIHLDAENTFSLIPYLDIVNELLEKKAKVKLEGDADNNLKSKQYPFNLPFNLAEEQIKLFLQGFKVKPETVYKLFHSQSESTIAARLSLGISPEMLEVIIKDNQILDNNLSELKAFYHLKDNQDLNTLQTVSFFLETTGISGSQLQELLYQNLSSEEEALADRFFINQGLNGYAKLDENEVYLEWISNNGHSIIAAAIPEIDEGIPAEWFNRVHRLLRLSKQSGISISDLDLILRSCCDHILNEVTLEYIAIVKSIADTYDLAIDVVCSFFTNINTLGFGNEDEPIDLFNRIFNLSFTSIDRQYFSGSELLPKQYQSLEDKKELTLSGDLFSLSQTGTRKRLLKALHLTPKELQLLVNTFEEKLGNIIDDSDSLREAQLKQLSLYYRVTTLADTMDITIPDLFNLLDILQQDPKIRQHSHFDSLIKFNIEELNCYKILASGSVEELMWLVQMLLALSSWLEKAQLSSAELKIIQTGKHQSEAEQVASEKKDIVGFNNLYQEFKPFLLTADYFSSEEIDQRTARIIYQNLIEDEIGLVSAQDNRLLKPVPEKIEQVISQGLNQLQIITLQDFYFLGIQEKLQEKIFTNLILNGYLKTDGTIIDETLPKNVDELKINNSFDNEVIFDLIYQLVNEEEGDSEEFSFFLSDLDGVKICNFYRDADKQAYKQELYDNLIYNGYIDEEGNVIDPLFFADTTNRDLFEANTDLNNYLHKIYVVIEEKTKAFEIAECRLSQDLFTELSLTEIEIVDLLENLKFNDYIDENQFIINKIELLNLDVNDFNLVLKYYPYRHQILGVIQNYLQKFKAKYYTLTAENFSKVSEEIVADYIYSELENNYLNEQKFTPASIDFFSDNENAIAFSLGNYFEENTIKLVFTAIQNLINTAYKYRLHQDSFAELKFTPDEELELFNLLGEQDYINADGTLNSQQIAYFLKINNALDIKLEGFEDYAKDIFFVLHNLAKKIDNFVQELVNSYLRLAQMQEEVLFSVLQEILEIPAEMVKVICRHLFNTSDNIVEELLAPILVSLDSQEKVTQKPDNYRFNIAFNRLRQFAQLALILDLDSVETEIIFQDQNLADKFPEKLILPPNSDRFTGLINLTIDGKEFPELKTEEPLDVILLYSKDNAKYWLYQVDDYQLLTQGNDDLSQISPLLQDKNIDAGFNDHKGNAWIISGTDFFCQEKGKLPWQKKDKELGKVKNNFDNIDKIDAAFVDFDHKIYLFAGEEYLRSSENLANIDRGYPRKIPGNWLEEQGLNLPEKYHHGIDAALINQQEKTYLFKDNQFIGDDDTEQEIEINQFWGKVKNNFTNIAKIDATLVLNEKIYLFAGDQCITWSYSLENENGLADEGSIQTLSNLFPDLPDVFQNGIDAIFKGADEKIYLFKDGNSFSCSLDFKVEGEEDELIDINQKWGNLTNNITDDITAGEELTTLVSAAFSGLDGKVYLFSNNQYFRYSGSNYAYVDEGYPLTIANHWGGLNQVDAAFILDGKTYLIGRNNEQEKIYVRYSTNDYSQQDEDYPKPFRDSWWIDHFNLENNDFADPDTVFTGQDGITYLLKNKQYIAYDKLRRWWSKPQAISDKWADLTFALIDAAFTGKDGRTYLFSGTDYLRYTDKYFNRLDDRYPKKIKTFWGRVKNNIQQNNHIDAAVVITNQEKEVNYTYLFSGNQFCRYTGDNYHQVDEGYPKAIATSLKDEPRFSNLEANLESGIDAIFSDRRNVYLFQSDRCLVFSESNYQQYHNPENKTIATVVEDQGILYIQDSSDQVAKQWYTLKNLEGNSVIEATITPPMLRESPNEFRYQPNTAFVGTDKSTYIFQENQCYNCLLEKSYPINEEWGRQRNNVVVNNHLDAVLVSRDGKTYLFSGNQYLTYTPTAENGKVLPIFADEHPKLIQDDWGGLDNVHLAFIRDEKTYLLEKPAQDGVFRYICYSSNDYSQPDGKPQSAEITWWQIPPIYLEEGFDRVDAILVQDEQMFLFKGDRFIQYDQEEDLWTYPRPISRIWRVLDIDDEAIEKEIIALFEKIVTVFTGIDGQTYFFSDGYVTSYDKRNKTFTRPEKINLHWGKVRNNIVDHNTVDAAFVLENKTTYLFSGDQYVRYSTADYRFIDDGYPKLIVDNLRQEDGFGNLPESFERRVKELQQQSSEILPQPIRLISAIVVNERNIYIFETSYCHVVSRSLTSEFEIKRLGAIKNNLSAHNRVDAAFINGNNQTFLFSGDQYVRYSDAQYEYIDEGYPQSISKFFAMENLGTAVAGFPEASIMGIDAAVWLKRDDRNLLYLFQGKTIYQSVLNESGWENTSVTISEVVPAPENSFNQGVDTAFIASDGKAYFFKNEQYIRYSHWHNEYADGGFPKLIKDNWGNLPKEFEKALDGSFIFEDKVYFVKGDRYVRYSDLNYQLIDPIYPQKFSFRWGDWNDYLLSDIHLITEFKKLQESSLSHDYTLSDLLNPNISYQKETYKMLAEIFDWDIEQIKWLRRKNAFYDNHLDVEVNFNLELIVKMADIFSVADKMSISPQNLYQEFSQKYFDQEEDKTGEVAQTLYQWLGLKHSTKDWQVLSRELHDKLNLIKHDALLPYAIANDEQIDNARDLFAQMLIDLNMGSEVMTSKIVEATSAIQLYLHRYFVNLEQINLKNGVAKEQLKQWWQWMRNYRVWEANRKVFLYPENYIRPELRDTKTPAFQKLEETLLQGEVTNELVSTAFYDYLNEFAIVGNLKIIGANVYQAPRYAEDQSIVLFGHTHTEPKQYYYRLARFINSGGVIWDNWLPINITINSSRVFPIYAFGRILLFWTEIEAYEESKPFIRSEGKEKNSTSTVETSDTTLKHKAEIKYSFYNFNQQWVSPQTLQQGIEIEYKIDSAYVVNAKSSVFFSGEYCLITSNTNPQGEVKKISEVYDFPAGIAEKFNSGIDAAVKFGKWLIFFKNENCLIGTVANSASGENISWTTPVAEIKDIFVNISTEDEITQVLELFKFLPQNEVKPQNYHSGIAAAFSPEQNTMCLIDHSGLPLFFNQNQDTSKLSFSEQKTPLSGNGFLHAWFKLLTLNLLRLEPVDAVFEDNNKNIFYILRKGQYECYRYNPDNSILPLEKLDGYPKPIKGNFSFNMDKFFNKLHVVETKQQGQDFISLTYTSPKANAVLLSGRINDNFEFESINFSLDASKDELWQELNTPFLAIAISEIIQITQQFSQDELEGKLNQFSELSRELVTQEEELERQKLEIIATIQVSIPQFIEEFGSRNRRTKVRRNRAEDIIRILESANRTFAHQSGNTPFIPLRETFSAFIKANAKNREQVLGALNEQLELANAIADSLFSPSFQASLQELKSSFNQALSEVKQNYVNYQNDFAQAQKAYSQKFQQRFKTVSNLVNTVNTFIESIESQATSLNLPESLPQKSEQLANLTTKINSISGSPWLSATENLAQSATALDTWEQLESVKAMVGESPLTAEIQPSLDLFISENEVNNQLFKTLQSNLNNFKEIYFGRFDLFPSYFGIENQANFTFGEPDWHIFEAKSGTFLCKPAHDNFEVQRTNSALKYEIIRVTTTTIPQLSSRLFSGGIDRLLSLDSQRIYEYPNFQIAGNNENSEPANDTERTIYYDPSRIVKIEDEDEDKYKVPGYLNLDYKGANSNYYWEIFFHAPFLIAQTLNNAQKFEDAKRWYEYIFDPTASELDQEGKLLPWKFLPFYQSEDLDFASELEQHLHRSLDIVDLKTEIEVYLNDPFDPHAIARIRQIAYQKAIVMAYIDNLLDWGDLLFRQYSIESINEARMLYILAYDLLGNKPENLGQKILSPSKTYQELINPKVGQTDLLLLAKESTELTLAENTPHRPVNNSYFFIPENSLFLEYWDRVEDRLSKIRNSLNIDGIKQALPLFQPAIDPLSIVQAIGSGGNLSQALISSNVPVPHYRFNFMLNKAQELVQKLNQFGNELLNILEKKDAEALSIMQNKQEGVIISMMQSVKEAQLAEAQANLQSLEHSRDGVIERLNHYQQLKAVDFIPGEIVQIGLMSHSVIDHGIAVAFNLIAALSHPIPKITIGPFSFGTQTGGDSIGEAASSAGESASSLAEGYSIAGEIAGILSAHERLKQDWDLQILTAQSDLQQVQAQIQGAKLQVQIAQREIQILAKEIDHNQSMRNFLKDKFTNQQLYQWLSSKLSGLYYQTYQLAFDMAKAAEKSFQFERGSKASKVNFIQGTYWNSQRKGLLAGESLGLDLDRLEKAFLDSNQRRLEISKNISLVELDPVAFLELKSKGVCEFSFPEAIFDYDFPGHYCRQIKTLSLAFDAEEGETVCATLTQLNHKTVLEPDAKAVKFLLNPKEQPPSTIRSNWRSLQQIVLSEVDEYEQPHGMFELRYEDDRYFPFEGTGAVSIWKLELNGKKGSYNVNEILDITINLKYTALSGGTIFANAVKGMLKPYDAKQFFDIIYDFSDAWQNFIANDSDELVLSLSRDYFPNMSSSKITGITTNIELVGDGQVSFIVNNNQEMKLEHGKYTDTTGLAIGNRGSLLTLTIKGNKPMIKNFELVFAYKAKVN